MGVQGEQFGQYRLAELIGSGGMGEVYRAFDTVRQRVVALKRLPANLADDEEFKARFRKESALVSKLTEPHIIPIHDFGEIQGRLFIDMRLVTGRDLAAVLAADGPLSAPRAVSVVSQVAAALDAAHAEALVHRDVKPSNVLLTGPAGREFVYLVDFGIARAVGNADATSMTVTGATVGTLDYMAPERFLGAEVDHRVDVYSLACLLYEALTAHKPFRAGTDLPAMLHAHLNTDPPAPSRERPSLPVALDAVIATGMAKQPEHRYPTAGDLADAAHTALTTTPTTTTPATSPSHQPPPTPEPPSAPPSWPAPPTPTPWPQPPGYQHPTQQRPQTIVQPSPWSGAGAGQGPTPPWPDASRRRWSTGKRVAVILGVVALLLAIAIPAAVLLIGSASQGAGRVVATIAVGVKPQDVVVGEGYTWVANFAGGSISRIDPRTNTSTQIPVGGTPFELAVADGAVWVNNYNDSVTRVEVATGQVSAPIATGPGLVTSIAAGGGYVWLSHMAEGTVSRVNTATLQVEGVPTRVGNAPGTMAFSDGTLYVLNTADQSMSALDGVTGAVLGSPLPLNRQIGGIEFNDGVIYILGQDGVIRVDARTFAVDGLIPLQGHGVVTANDGEMWVAYPLDNVVRRFRLDTRAPDGEIKSLGRGVREMVYDPANKALWVANEEQSSVIRIEVSG